MKGFYHIYAKQECLFHSLTKEQFKNTWKPSGMVGLMKTDYELGDLSYEEVSKNPHRYARVHIDNHYINCYN